MVRQRTRKSVEELYASKFETNQTKSASTSHNNNSNNNNNSSSNAKQTARTDRDYGGYIITSNTAYNAQCSANNAQTGRRKTSARPATASKTEKFYTKDEKLLHLEEIKKDPILKPRTSRNEKCPYAASANNNVYDNKSYVNFSENVHKELHSNHSHHHRDDDKDDDTEEFFELIRQTVETAIGKSISEMLNRNFRELSAKIDRFSSELKATNSHLNKLQAEINNKVVHYGEENSRHFRYLCMKSEYDKMFYQHHTMLATSPGGTDKRTSLPKPAPPSPEPLEKPPNPCSCSSRKTVPSEPHKTSSEERSVSQKSSEMGMREVLEHIQRFCTQMQMNELKCEDRINKSSFRIDEAMKINKQAFDEDEDDFQMSSDGMTPRSDEHIPHKYGGNTMRSCSTTRGGNGGGDA